MPSAKPYTPPAGYHFLTPLYDVGVRLSTRETVWRSAMVELMSPKDDDVLLDIGSGTGSLALVLARKNAATRYFGIDPDRHAVQIARDKVRRARPRETNLANSGKSASSWRIADTQPNADGVLLPLMGEAGFANARELKRFDTVTGSISILSGTK